MEDLQAQMNSILKDPQMMEKIMSMAQALSSQPSAEPVQEASAPLLPEIDIAMVQKLSGFIGKSNIDSNQRCLLDALSPYLPHTRIAKLEKAMRAAKLATLASSLLTNSGLSFHTGR